MSGKAVRETLGFLAVVAGLVFVGWEIRQNSLSVQAATYQDLIAQIADLDELATGAQEREHRRRLHDGQNVCRADACTEGTDRFAACAGLPLRQSWWQWWWCGCSSKNRSCGWNASAWRMYLVG